MERPKVTIEPAKDKYDHELTPIQADFIALTDALLEHREPESELTFVDLAVEYSASEVLEKLEQICFSSLLAGPEEQLAIESDGSYYPILDLRKSQGQLTGVGVRAWGWDDKKIRYTDTDNDPVKYPRQYRKYKGEIDKIRELDISFGYSIGDEHVVETIKLYGSTSRPDYVTASRNLSSMVYAETGYEGHGGKSMPDLTGEDVEQFLNLIAEIIGDTPKSTKTKMKEDLEAFKEKWTARGYGELVEKLIASSWPAQALYELTGRERESLNGATIQDVAESGNTELDAVAKGELEETIDDYESRRLEREKRKRQKRTSS